MKENDSHICGLLLSNSPDLCSTLVTLACQVVLDWKGTNVFMVQWKICTSKTLTLNLYHYTNFCFHFGFLIFFFFTHRPHDPNTFASPRCFSQFYFSFFPSQIQEHFSSFCGISRVGRLVGHQVIRCVHQPLSDIFT